VGSAIDADGPEKGRYVTKPRGDLHAMWNAVQDTGAHDRDHQSGGFEGFFREAVDMVEAGPPTVEAVSALSAAYGIEGSEAEWLSGVTPVTG
jgi:hypothetical protein